LDIFSEINEKQITVISEGVNIKEFTVKRDIDIQSKFGIPKRFLFFPAQLWKHKNHITVLKALKKLETQGIIIPLVMTGDKYSASDDILNYIKDNDMHYVYYLGKIDFKYLVALYQQAEFLMTATLYESSSLPILESVASDTAIIASKTPPNIEMLDNLKLNLFEPLDVEDCANIIKKCWLEDDKIITEQIKYNTNNIQLYSWDKVALKYIEFLKENINVK
jgi:glycosyltransferase involved in cell wall biosynthesis